MRDWSQPDVTSC